MRVLVVAGLVVAGLVSVGAGGAVWMRSSASPAEKIQAAEKAPAPAPAAPPAQLAAKADPLADVTGTVPASEPKPAPAPAKRACANPNALGIGRVVEIDTTGGPGFGFEHFKQLDFLADKEVVLTFDDGPWPVNTPAVLKALADECTTGIFFAVGKHATYHPDILRQVAAAGHTVGSHTWSHVNLNKKGMTEQQAKDEIEKGFSAVRLALGAAPAPFFRFPQLQHPPAMVTYLGTRDVAMFSTDLDSFDFKASTPDKIVETVMTKVNKLGKGIILMHDFQKHTGEALPTLLSRLKAGGYKVVQMKAKAQLQTIASYDAELVKDAKLPTISSRPVSSVVQTVGN
ncbi:MAG TPA: polysaccharide deacetylase family protein [Bradyrhizobium sp.]|nr:polysaccharide deacetylase family protein [Bradyrhizobium sp.]